MYASLFALMAIGLTLTYLTTKVPNFAYGSFVTIGTYTAYTLFKINGISPYYATTAAFVIGGASSVVMYLGVLRPLARRGSSLVSQMIATFGIDIAFVGIIGIYTDYMAVRYRLNDTKQFFPLLADFSFGGVPGIVLIAPFGLALITLVLYVLLNRTKFGVAMRASVENPPLARILGINVERVYVVSWMLAGGFAGLAGSLYTLWLPGGTDTGSVIIVEIFASSILGGLSSLFGAVLGGLVIGGSEIVITTDLAGGFGFGGTAIIAALLIVIGAYLWLKKRLRARVVSAAAILVGAYIVVEMIFGYPIDFLVPGLVRGFGAWAITYQKAIPLVIMVVTLLLLPKGLVSIDWGRLLRREERK